MNTDAAGIEAVAKGSQSFCTTFFKVRMPADSMNNSTPFDLNLY